MSASTPSPNNPTPSPGETQGSPEPQHAINIDPNVLAQLAVLSNAANQQRRQSPRQRGGRAHLTASSTIHPDTQARIWKYSQYYRDDYPKVEPDPTRPRSTLIDPAVAPQVPAQPARILDYVTGPLGPAATPEVNGGPTDHFDRLVLGGLRRSLENWRRKRPAENLEAARRKQNFYRSIAHVALVEAGFTELPQGFEPVIVYDPSNPEIQPIGRKQRKHKEQILGKDTKKWQVRGHVIKKSRHKSGFVDTLKATHKSKSVTDWAHGEQQIARGKRQIARDPHTIDRQRLMEVVQEPYLEKLAARDEKMKEYQEIPDSDTAAKNAVYAELLAAQNEATQAYIDLLPEYVSTAQAVEQRYPFEPYVDKQTKHSKKTNRKHRSQLRHLLHETEGGRDGRRRNNKIKKWGRKATNAPAKAQKRTEKHLRKVNRKDKRRAQVKQTIFDAQSALYRIKNSLNRKDPPDPTIQMMV